MYVISVPTAYSYLNKKEVKLKALTHGLVPGPLLLPTISPRSLRMTASEQVPPLGNKEINRLISFDLKYYTYP